MNTWKDIFTIAVKLPVLALIVCLLWLLTVFTAVNSPHSTWEYWRRHTNILVGVGQRGGSSMIRFREIENYRDIDIAFIGSSHSYRSFDPRIFDSLGLETFNMGSRNQNLVNSYFLLRQHIDQLNPKLLIIEIYWDILGGTGLESYLDLTENYPHDGPLIEMLPALKDIRAVNALLARWLEVNRPEYPQIAVNLMPMDTYVGRGYVEKDARYHDQTAVAPYSVTINDSQLEYLSKIIAMVQDRGTKAVLVVQPLPPQRIHALRNAPEISERLRTFAAARAVPYLDLGELMNLRDEDFFYDSNHLTQRGVELFDRRLIQELERLNLLPVKG